MKTKQLSNCCKAGIRVTGKERPNHFACEQCGRIIGTPMNKKNIKDKELDDAVNERIEYVRERASRMLLSGNTPTPDWWLERIKEIIDELEAK